MDEDYETFEDADDPDMAYERHLETLPFILAETELQAQMEAQFGVDDLAY